MTKPASKPVVYVVPPMQCDICSETFATKDNPNGLTVMVDGRTQQGPWANMCSRCHRIHGVGLGTGKGQRYTISLYTGKWTKTGG